MSNTTVTGNTIHLIISEDENPTITLKPGMKLEVHSVQLVDPQLKKLPIAKATLCGGSSTCIAIINVAE